MAPESTTRLSLGPFSYNVDSRKADGPTGPFVLTVIEGKLFDQFLQHRRKPTLWSDLATPVWGPKTDKTEKSLRDNFDQYLKKLRLAFGSNDLFLVDGGLCSLNEAWLASHEPPGDGPLLPAGDHIAGLQPAVLLQKLDAQTRLGVLDRQLVIAEAVSPLEAFSDGLRILQRNVLDHGVRYQFRFSTYDVPSATAFLFELLDRLGFVRHGQDLNLPGLEALVGRVALILSPAVQRFTNTYVINAEHRVNAQRIICAQDYTTIHPFESGAGAYQIGSAWKESFGVSQPATLVRLGQDARNRDALRQLEERLKLDLPHISDRCRRLLLGRESDQRTMEIPQHS